MALKSQAHPPLGEIHRLDNTYGMFSISLSCIPNLPDGVSTYVILQDGVIPFNNIVIPIKATCNYLVRFLKN